MTTTKHTPGPWYYTGEYVNTATGDNICRIQGRITLRDGAADANAALIAAAPELLSALQALFRQTVTLRLPPDKNCLQMVAAAIDKAEGR